jgi:hypothetical protein
MTLNDNILSFIEQTPSVVQTGIAERVKLRRLESALTQKELATREQAFLFQHFDVLNGQEKYLCER